MAAAAGGEDDLVSAIGDTLSALLKAVPVGWVPLFSAWSLQLLGRLSARYAVRAHVPHSAGGLADSVQLWLCCLTARARRRALAAVAVQCVRRDTGACIKPLPETSATCTTHFDWVVGQIGTRFSGTIRERVLAVGLTEFCAQKPVGAGGLPGQQPCRLHSVSLRRPKLVINMRGTEGAHPGECGPPDSPGGPDSTGTDTSTSTSSGAVLEEARLTSVPFLLHLASMSPMLLITLSTEIAKTVSVSKTMFM